MGMAAKWIEPVLYLAKVGIKKRGDREFSITLTVFTDSGDTPEAVRKRLTSRLESEYESVRICATVRIKELKKIRSDASVYLGRYSKT